jgi:flagellar basal body-associated protein FliL
MLRLRLAVTCLLALVLTSSWLMGQDTKSTSDDAQPSKSKGALPKYFGRLGLTDDQKQKVYKIATSYKTKIDALTEQLEELKSQRQAELLKILSDTQKTHLRELQTRESQTKEKESTTTTKKEEPKKEEKTDKK